MYFVLDQLVRKNMLWLFFSWLQSAKDTFAYAAQRIGTLANRIWAKFLRNCFPELNTVEKRNRWHETCMGMQSQTWCKQTSDKFLKTLQRSQLQRSGTKWTLRGRTEKVCISPQGLESFLLFVSCQVGKTFCHEILKDSRRKDVCITQTCVVRETDRLYTSKKAKMDRGKRNPTWVSGQKDVCTTRT